MFKIYQHRYHTYTVGVWILCISLEGAVLRPDSSLYTLHNTSYLYPGLHSDSVSYQLQAQMSAFTFTKMMILKGCHGVHMLASQEPGLLRQDGLPIQVPTPLPWIKVLKKMCMKSQFSVQSTCSLILLPVVFDEIQDYQSVYNVYWLKK